MSERLERSTIDMTDRDLIKVDTGHHASIDTHFHGLFGVYFYRSTKLAMATPEVTMVSNVT